MKDLTETIKELKDNPIFRMSLGSKELFHSNFMEFLWDLNRTAFLAMVNDFFDNLNKIENLNNDCYYEFGREVENFDICVFHKEGHKRIYDLIIENKVKSIPYKEQLDGYWEKVSKSNPNCRFMLLTLSGDFPDKSEIKWKVVTYNDLIKGINNHYNNYHTCIYDTKISKSPRESLYIKDYCSFIQNLVEFKEFVINESAIEGQLLFNNEDINRLKTIRLHDLYIKMRASWFVMNLKKKLQTQFNNKSDVKVVHKYKELDGKGTGVYLNVDMNQGNGQIAAWIKDKYGNTFEVVIQGNQYRHGIAQSKLTTERGKYDRLNALYNRISKSQGPINFLNFYNTQDDIMPNKPGQFKNTNIDRGGLFRSYGESYIYRYRTIGKNDTVKALMDSMLDDIQKIFPNTPEFSD